MIKVSWVQDSLRPVEYDAKRILMRLGKNYPQVGCLAKSGIDLDGSLEIGPPTHFLSR